MVARSVLNIYGMCKGRLGLLPGGCLGKVKINVVLKNAKGGGGYKQVQDVCQGLEIGRSGVPIKH